MLVQGVGGSDLGLAGADLEALEASIACTKDEISDIWLSLLAENVIVSESDAAVSGLRFEEEA